VRRLVLSAAADADLRRIAAHTEREWGEILKRRYLAALQRRLLDLRDRPEIGRPRNDVRTGIRSIASGRHVIFYSATSETIDVLRVLHDAMDVHRHIESD